MHIGIARQFRFPSLYAFLFPVAYLLGAALVFTSVAMHLRGKVSWKGRTYTPESNAASDGTPASPAAGEPDSPSGGGQRGIA
jgi:hypothetical protein